MSAAMTFRHYLYECPAGHVADDDPCSICERNTTTEPQQETPMEHDPKPNPAKILAENAGALESRLRRSTGTVVTIYNGEAADLDTEGGALTLICEDHGQTLAVDGMVVARSFAAHAEDWCSTCRGDDDPTDPTTDCSNCGEAAEDRTPGCPAASDGVHRVWSTALANFNTEPQQQETPMEATTEVTDPARPWTDETEARRSAEVAAGIEPHLYRWWMDTTTASLVETLEEVASFADLATVATELNIEIGFRTGRWHRPIELSRRSFLGRCLGGNVGGTWLIGPCLVDVVVESAGPVFWHTYHVIIDGHRQWAGPATHLTEDGAPPNGGKFLELVPVEDDDAPAERLCGACGQFHEDEPGLCDLEPFADGESDTRQFEGPTADPDDRPMGCVECAHYGGGWATTTLWGVLWDESQDGPPPVHPVECPNCGTVQEDRRGIAPNDDDDSIARIAELEGIIQAIDAAVEDGDYGQVKEILGRYAYDNDPEPPHGGPSGESAFYGGSRSLVEEVPLQPVNTAAESYRQFCVSRGLDPNTVEAFDDYAEEVGEAVATHNGDAIGEWFPATDPGYDGPAATSSRCEYTDEDECAMALERRYAGLPHLAEPPCKVHGTVSVIEYTWEGERVTGIVIGVEYEGLYHVEGLDLTVDTFLHEVAVPTPEAFEADAVVLGGAR